MRVRIFTPTGKRPPAGTQRWHALASTSVHPGKAVGLAQSAVSQHLARMRAEGLIKARRDGQTIYYQVADKNVARMLKLLESMFCQPK